MQSNDVSVSCVSTGLYVLELMMRKPESYGIYGDLIIYASEMFTQHRCQLRLTISELPFKRSVVPVVHTAMGHPITS
jgi:hypothetical protein